MVAITIDKDKKGTDNYLNLRTGELTVNKSKTSKAVGTKKDILSKPLMTVIRRYVKDNGIEDKLFEGKSSDALVKRIPRVLGYSNNEIRRAYATCLGDINDPDQIKEAAQKLGTSVDCVLHTYNQR